MTVFSEREHNKQHQAGCESGACTSIHSFIHRARATHPLAHTPARAFALHRDARSVFYSVDGEPSWPVTFRTSPALKNIEGYSGFHCYPQTFFPARYHRVEEAAARLCSLS